MATGFALRLESAVETMAMAMLVQEEAPATEPDMAKAAPADAVIVAHYTDALSAAGRNRTDFESVMTSLRGDKSVRAIDMIEIARAYRGGGERARSKSQALQMIEKRFVEIILDARKSTIAKSARPW